MRVAMIGLKGLPGVHGGVERHVEELGAHLAGAGFSVTAYCRPHYTPGVEPVRGVRLRVLPTIHTKHLDAAVHTLIACLDILARPFDVVHIHGIGPALFAPIPRLAGKTVVVTIHSRDYLRSKWGAVARLALRLGERTALAFANRVIVVNAEMAAAHGENQAGGRVVHIPNGVADPNPSPPVEPLAEWNLEPRGYLLFVGRISPEKGPHHLLRAFADLDTPLRLVLAGGESHVAEFDDEVRRLGEADPRVVTTGYVDAARLESLYAHAAAFVLPSEHEGLPVAMLEAMSHAVPVVATTLPATKEIARTMEGDLVTFAGSTSRAGLRLAIERCLADPDTRARAERARAHVLSRYRWTAVAARTADLYREAVTGFTEEQLSIPCPACGSPTKTPEYDGTRSGRVARCRDCGMVYSVSPPPVEDLPPAFTDAPRAYLANARDRLGRLTAAMPTHGKNLLDVGCFDGRFAGAAQTLGYNVTGLEPVADAARRATDAFGFPVVVGTLEDAALPGPFDVVSFIHVFEHLKNPRAALARCRELLTPGGALLIEIPAYDAWSRRLAGRSWRQFIADHDRFYTGPVLRRIAEEEGFEILRDEKVGKVLTPALLADRVGRYYSVSLGRAIRRLAGLVGQTERPFSLRLGDIRLVVARRTGT